MELVLKNIHRNNYLGEFSSKWWRLSAWKILFGTNGTDGLKNRDFWNNPKLLNKAERSAEKIEIKKLLESYQHKEWKWACAKIGTEEKKLNNLRSVLGIKENLPALIEKGKDAINGSDFVQLEEAVKEIKNNYPIIPFSLWVEWGEIEKSYLNLRLEWLFQQTWRELNENNWEKASEYRQEIINNYKVPLIKSLEEATRRRDKNSKHKESSNATIGQLEKRLKRVDEEIKWIKLAESELSALEREIDYVWKEDELKKFKSKIEQFPSFVSNNDKRHQQFRVRYLEVSSVKNKIFELFNQAKENIENYQLLDETFEQIFNFYTINKDSDCAEKVSQRINEDLRILAALIPDEEDNNKSLNGDAFSDVAWELWLDKEEKIWRTYVCVLKKACKIAYFVEGSWQEWTLNDLEKNSIDEVELATNYDELNETLILIKDWKKLFPDAKIRADWQKFCSEKFGGYYHLSCLSRIPGLELAKIKILADNHWTPQLLENLDENNFVLLEYRNCGQLLLNVEVLKVDAYELEKFCQLLATIPQKTNPTEDVEQQINSLIIPNNLRNDITNIWKKRIKELETIKKQKEEEQKRENETIEQSPEHDEKHENPNPLLTNTAISTAISQIKNYWAISGMGGTIASVCGDHWENAFQNKTEVEIANEISRLRGLIKKVKIQSVITEIEREMNKKPVISNSELKNTSYQQEIIDLVDDNDQLTKRKNEMVEEIKKIRNNKLSQTLRSVTRVKAILAKTSATKLELQNAVDGLKILSTASADSAEQIVWTKDQVANQKLLDDLRSRLSKATLPELEPEREKLIAPQQSTLLSSPILEEEAQKYGADYTNLKPTQQEGRQKIVANWKKEENYSRSKSCRYCLEDLDYDKSLEFLSAKEKIEKELESHETNCPCKDNQNAQQQIEHSKWKKIKNSTERYFYACHYCWGKIELDKRINDWQQAKKQALADLAYHHQHECGNNLTNPKIAIYFSPNQGGNQHADLSYSEENEIDQSTLMLEKDNQGEIYQEQTTTQKSKSIDWTPWAIGVGVILVGITIFALFLWKNRNKKKKS